jgi:hypothetical protein
MLRGLADFVGWRALLGSYLGLVQDHWAYLNENWASLTIGVER